MPSGKPKITKIQAGSDPQELYLLVDESEDRLLRTGKQIIDACQLHVGAHVWVDNFKQAAHHIAAWANTRVGIAFITVELRNISKLLFSIVPTSESYNFALADDIADLTVYLNTQASIGYCEVRQVPSWDTQCFISTDAQLIWKPGVSQSNVKQQDQPASDAVGA